MVKKSCLKFLLKMHRGHQKFPFLVRSVSSILFIYAGDNLVITHTEVFYNGNVSHDHLTWSHDDHMMGKRENACV